MIVWINMPKNKNMYKWDNHMHNHQVNEQKLNVSRERRILILVFMRLCDTVTLRYMDV